MGISDRHILVPYLWIRPISSWVRFGVKNQKKVDDAVVLAFGACTTIPIWAMLWAIQVVGTFFDGLGRFLGFADPQRGVREPVFSLRTICLRGLTPVVYLCTMCTRPW